MSSSRGRPLLVGYLTVIFLLALTSCAATTPRVPLAESSRVSATASAVGDLGSISLQYDLLTTARDKVDRRCLQSGGYGSGPSQSVDVLLPSGNVAGIEDIFNSITQARSEGYGLALAPADAPDTSNSARSNRLLYEQLEYGSGSQSITYEAPSGVRLSATAGGCFGKSARAIFGTIKDFLVWSSVRNVLGAQRPVRPAQIKQHLEEYSVCMLAKNIRTTSPTGTRKLAASRFGPRDLREVSAAERAFAVVDAECQFKSRLRTSIQSVWVASNTSWINENAEWLSAVETIRRSAVSRSRSVLSEG